MSYNFEPDTCGELVNGKLPAKKRNFKKGTAESKVAI
jgi:hypothetical protein